MHRSTLTQITKMGCMQERNNRRKKALVKITMIDFVVYRYCTVSLFYDQAIQYAFSHLILNRRWRETRLKYSIIYGVTVLRLEKSLDQHIAWYLMPIIASIITAFVALTCNANFVSLFTTMNVYMCISIHRKYALSIYYMSLEFFIFERREMFVYYRVGV